jgi:signal transduction histidine kinase
MHLFFYIPYTFLSLFLIGIFPNTIHSESIDLKEWDQTNARTIHEKVPFYHRTLLIETKDPYQLVTNCIVPFDHKNYKSNESVCKDTRLTLRANDIIAGSNPDGYVELGKGWTKSKLINHESIPAKTYGVYSIAITNVPKGEWLIQTTTISSVSRIWKKTEQGIQLIKIVGVPEENINGYTGNRTWIHFEISEGVYLVESANHYNLDGGIWQRISIYPMKQRLVEYQINQFVENVLIGGYLVFSLFQFQFFFLRKKQKRSFYLGILGLGLAIRMSTMTPSIASLIDTKDLYNYSRKIEYLGFLIPCGAVLKYIHETFKNSKYRIYFNSLASISLLFSFYVLISDSGEFTFYRDMMQNYILFSMFFIFIILILNFNSPNEMWKDSSRNLLLFFTIFMIGVFNDVLVNYKIISTPLIGAYTFFIFILGQGYLVARSNAIARNRVEILLDELKEETKAKELVSQQKIQTEEFLKSISEEYIATQSDLEQAKEELDQASNQLIQAEKLSSLGAMVAGIAHEINNPVNFIEMSRFQEKSELDELRNYLFSLIPEGTEGESFKKSLEDKFKSLYELNSQIQTGVKRVVDINHSMRNAARTDLQLEKNVPLAEVVRESLLILGAKTKEFQMIEDIDSNVVAEVRRSQFGQVIMNLVSNAADALKEKKEQLGANFQGKIKLSLYSLNEKAILRVEDNGNGIPLKIRDQIMNSFFTTKKAGVGTGLGLAIVEKIILSHQGTIEIGESEELGGAKFTISLNI